MTFHEAGVKPAFKRELARERKRHCVSAGPWIRVEPVPGWFRCSFCRAKEGRAVVVTVGRLPYWTGICFGCAEAIGDAAGEVAEERETT